jgi:hypothetical protein
MQMTQLVKSSSKVTVRAQHEYTQIRLTMLPDGRYSGRVGSRIVKGRLVTPTHWTTMQRVTAALNEVQP